MSSQQGDNSDSHQIIPISFNMKELLRQNYQNYVKDTFLVQTRSQAIGVKVPTVHGTTKPLVPHDMLDKWPVKMRRKEVKPIIIGDDRSIDLDNKPEFDTPS